MPRLLVLIFALGYIALAVKAGDTRMLIGRAETGTWASLYVTSGALSSIALFWLLTVPSAGKHRLVVGVTVAIAVLIAGISLEVHEQGQRFFGLFWDVMATFPGVVSGSLLLVAAALYPRPLVRLGSIVWVVAIALALARVVYPLKLASDIPADALWGPIVMVTGGLSSVLVLLAVAQMLRPATVVLVGLLLILAAMAGTLYGVLFGVPGGAEVFWFVLLNMLVAVSPFALAVMACEVGRRLVARTEVLPL